MEKTMMKMNSSRVAACNLDDNCTEAPPVEVSRAFLKLYKWPESDVEFLARRLNMEKDSKAIRSPALKSGSSPPVYHYHESFASRQRFLRSYTFSRPKETVGEKMKKWLKREKKVVNKPEPVQRRKIGYGRFIQVVHKFFGSSGRPTYS